MGMFLGGLQTSIHDRIPESEMTTVFTAIHFAYLIGHSDKPSGYFNRVLYTSGTTSRPLRPLYHDNRPSERRVFATAPASSAPTSAHSQNSAIGSSEPRFSHNTRHLTIEEMREFRAKGKFYHCSQSYGPLHKYAVKYLTIIEVDKYIPSGVGDD
ncbi:hypothetical protein ACS0TY_021165 [Phlomoides rotata]